MRAEVGGHDEDGVLEVDGAALGVGEAAVVEDLQEHVEDVGVRLLDLVEEDDRVGAAADGLGELAALVVADVAGRRADEARDGVLLHVLGHVDADHGGLVVEEELGEGAGGLGLADAGGAEEDEAADGALGVAEAGAAAADGVGDGGERGVLADDALAQAVLHLDELLHLAFEHLGDGDAGPVGDDGGDVFFVDLFLQHAVRRFARPADLAASVSLRSSASALGISPYWSSAARCRLPLRVCSSASKRRASSCVLSSAMRPMAPRSCLPAGAQGLGLFADFGEFVLDGFEALAGGFVLLALEGGLLDFERCGAAFEVVDLGGDGADLDGERGGGLVDQVDGLVGQEAVGDVAVRERGGGDDGGVLDADLVVGLVALAQAAQDGDGVFDVGLADVDDLEAALEGGVLLDVLAVLVEGGCADGAQAAAGERGLEHVAGVHGALGRARADEGVQLVDEEDDLAVGVFDLLEHGLEAVFELAAVLGAGDHAGEVEGDDALVFEDLGDVAVDDAAGEAFDDGGLADAGLADEDGIVFGAAGEDLDDAANLFVAADDGVELALAGEVGEVFAVFFERLELALGVLVGDALRAAHGGERLEDGVVGRAHGGEGVAGGVAFGFGEGEEEVLGGDVLVLEDVGLFGGAVEDLLQGGGHAGLGVAAGDLGQLGDGGVRAGEELLHADACAFEHGQDDALAVFQQGGEQVHGQDFRVAVLGGHGGGGLDGLLRLDGEFFPLECHHFLRCA